jgi:hypothetical protein
VDLADWVDVYVLGLGDVLDLAAMGTDQIARISVDGQITALALLPPAR